MKDSDGNVGTYLYKRLRRRTDSEFFSKEKFKKAFLHKRIFADNRTARNREYVAQRKYDFAVSQERVRELTLKLQQEFELEVSEHLRRYVNCVALTKRNASTQISASTAVFSQCLCDAAIALTVISDALSFVPGFFSRVVKHFHAEGLTFTRDSPRLPEFWSRDYRRPLRADTARLLATLCEGAVENSVTPVMKGRTARAVALLLKPLIFSDDECRDLADALGWKCVFADEIDSLFSLLCETPDDVLIFGFPRHPPELEALRERFKCGSREGLFPHPQPSSVEPFDALLEVCVPDEAVLRDVLAQLENSQTGACHDVRQLALETEEEIGRLRHRVDPHFDVEQYAS
jgi:hypothetical protein